MTRTTMTGTTTSLIVLAALAGLGLSARPAAAQQTLYVSNFSNNTIEKFSSTGTDLGTFASAGLNQPFGLAFDSAGNLYAANSGNRTVEEFTPGGVGTVFANTGLAGPGFLAFGPAVSAAPEPSEWAALGFTALGVGGLLLRARRRRPAGAGRDADAA